MHRHRPIHIRAMWHGRTEARDIEHGMGHAPWPPCPLAIAMRCPPRSPRFDRYIGLSPRKSQRHAQNGKIPRAAGRAARAVDRTSSRRRATPRGVFRRRGDVRNTRRARARAPSGGRRAARRPATARPRAGARSLERVGSIGPYTSTSGPTRRHDLWRHNGDTPITVTVAPTAHDAKAQRAKTDRPRTESR